MVTFTGLSPKQAQAIEVLKITFLLDVEGSTISRKNSISIQVRVGYIIN